MRMRSSSRAIPLRRLAALILVLVAAVMVLASRPQPAGAANSQFRLSAASYSGTSGSIIPITVQRIGGTGSVSVQLNFSSGGTANPAAPGADYTDPGTIIFDFGPDEDSKTTQALQALPGAGSMKTLKVTLSISPVFATDSLATPTEATIVINPSTLPTITSVTPGAVPATGGPITVTGTNLGPGSQVNIDPSADGQDQPCGNQVRNDAGTVITCDVPAMPAGPANVYVFTPGGNSNEFPITITGGPTITGLDPNSGPATGGQQVAISGTGLDAVPCSGITFGGTPVLTCQHLGNSLITATAPGHAAGTVNVQATSPAGTSPDTASDDYTYTAGAGLTGVVPASGPAAGGNTVKVTGTNLGATLGVKFDGITVTVSNITPTEVTVVVPQHPAGAVPVVVTTATGTLTGTYTYTSGPPTVAALSPATVELEGGDLITVTGTGFLGGATATVSFGGTDVEVTYVGGATGDNRIVSDTQIRVKAPSRALRGVVEVTVTTPIGTSPTAGEGNDFRYGTGPELVTYQLSPGFNLITWVGAQDAAVLAAIRGRETPDNPVTTDVSPQVSAIFRWSATGNGCAGAEPCWLGYFPGSASPGANTLATFEAGVAYWVAVPGESAASWSILSP